MRVIVNNGHHKQFVLVLNTLDDECEDMVKIIGSTDTLDQMSDLIADYMVNTGVEDGDSLNLFKWNGAKYVPFEERMEAE